MVDATDREASDEGGYPDPPLPEESGLTLEEYLAMQRAIGHPTRYRIVRTLLAREEVSASELGDAVEAKPHNFHYHLDELVDVGLADKRQRRTPDSRGFYTYYRPTAMGRAILEHGVEELMRREREFDETYESTTPP